MLQITLLACAKSSVQQCRLAVVFVVQEQIMTDNLSQSNYIIIGTCMTAVRVEMYFLLKSVPPSPCYDVLT